MLQQRLHSYITNAHNTMLMPECRNNNNHNNILEFSVWVGRLVGNLIGASRRASIGLHSSTASDIVSRTVLIEKKLWTSSSIGVNPNGPNGQQVHGKMFIRLWCMWRSAGVAMPCRESRFAR